jgi:hypothetical protein
MQTSLEIAKRHMAKQDMKGLSMSDRLMIGAAWLELALGEMEVEGKRCRCCGTLRRFKFGEYKAALFFGPTIKRIRLFADEIRKVHTKDDPSFGGKS